VKASGGRLRAILDQVSMAPVDGSAPSGMLVSVGGFCWLLSVFTMLLMAYVACRRIRVAFRVYRKLSEGVPKGDDVVDDDDDENDTLNVNDKDSVEEEEA
jgi:hypothetical protein